MTEKTRIHLLRHGEVQGAGVPRYNGHIDVPLSPRGVGQYHDLRQRFPQGSIAACYCSDLTRCVTGARILGEHLGVEPVIDRNLRELSVGVWEGKTWAELMENHPDQWQARLADLVNYRPPGGENLLDLESRVMPVIWQIVASHRGQEVVVVAHGGVNRVILLSALGAPLANLFALEQTYACVNVIDYFADGKSVVKLVNG